MGSFRISDAKGRNLIAQVNVSKQDEGTAIWNGPSGSGAPVIKLGDAYQAGGCWTISNFRPDRYEDSRICAWGLDEKVYLGPSPRRPPSSSVIYFGTRIGIYDEIVSRQGINTANARITTKASKSGAVTFCREYGKDYSFKCIDEQMQPPLLRVVHGNCKNKTFVDPNGNKYAFLGKAPKVEDGITAEFAIRNLSTGEILDGSSASGYDIRLGIYQALCPKTAPKSSGK